MKRNSFDQKLIKFPKKLIWGKFRIFQEISRILEPYNEVELSYVAREVRLSKGLVEKTIATIILDKTIRGTIFFMNSGKYGRVLDRAEKIEILEKLCLKASGKNKLVSER